MAHAAAHEIEEPDQQLCAPSAHQGCPLSLEAKPVYLFGKHSVGTKWLWPGSAGRTVHTVRSVSQGTGVVGIH